MSTGLTASQTKKVAIGKAKAQAISNISEAGFALGMQEAKEIHNIEKAEDTLQDIAKDENKKAQDRARKAGWGRLAGTLIGYGLSTLLPGSAPLWQKALLVGGGGLAGTGLAGGFKDYGIEIEDSLVPEGILYPSAYEELGERKEDLEDAFDDLTQAQRDQIGMNFLADSISGWTLGKLGQTSVGETGETIDDLRKLGKEGKIDYGYLDYLKDIFSEAFGSGISEKRLEDITEDDYFNYMNWMDNEGNIVAPTRPSIGIPKEVEDLAMDLSIEETPLEYLEPWKSPEEYILQSKYPNANIITSGSGGDNLENESWLNTILSESHINPLDTLDVGIDSLNTVTSSDSLGLLNNENFTNMAVDSLEQLNNPTFQTNVDTLKALIDSNLTHEQIDKLLQNEVDSVDSLIDSLEKQSSFYDSQIDSLLQGLDLGYKRKPNMNVANNLTPLRYIGEMG